MPDAATLSTIQQLGTTGFAILVLWWMYRHSADRVDNLNKEIRDKVLDQLNQNTKAFERVLEHFSKH